ncbi:hypothetical protein GCM10010971_12630 [Silvimonas amylolytica]|uniref:Glycosyltransferase 2-like domain-containing protein n=2 Tax=Silvimonas amylolytica TaxID=449663 RepID=A0ABQ2PIL5_9NEIS|nr:hypothetical protein GCM10010971_12630 [Silvimonas amylolytica]
MIFIPAYNCEKQIPRVLGKINDEVQQFVQEVVVIDNGSADKTLASATEAIQPLKIKATILKNTQNYSLGGSIKRALLYAIEQGYDYMIVLHGDDQADIRDLLPVLRKGEHRENDLLIGARFHPDSVLQGYSATRIYGNKVLNFVCSLINHRRVDDLIAGINCFNVSFFKSRFFMQFPDNLTFDAHVLLYAFNKKARVKYVPITWREEDQISNAKVFKQAWIILKLFMSYVFKGDKVFAGNKSGRPDGFQYTSEVIAQK